MNLLDRLRRALAVTAPEKGRAAQLERALALHESGDLAGAATHYAQMLASNPQDADALHLTGLLAHQEGDQLRALDLITRAIRAQPAAPRFHFNQGNVLAALERTPAAAESFRRAAELDPGHAASWFNLGSAQARLNPQGDAHVALRRAWELEPGLPGLRQALAQALCNVAGAGSLTSSAYREAVQLLADHWTEAIDPQEARLLLAYALQQNRQWSEAAHHYRAMLENFPDLEIAHNNLANCCNQLGQMTEAITHYREVQRLSPDNALAASSIVSCLNYDSEATPEQMLAAHTGWARRFAAAPLKATQHANSRAAGRRLRLGYVSPDLRRHPVSTLFAPVIERHDPRQFEVFCYYNHPDEDAVTQRIKKAAQGWVDIHQWNDAALASRIQEDGIDILVDLAGHTSYGRLRAYAAKPAPVMVSWLGYFNTTGLAQMDAFISDVHSSPPGQETWFSEKLLRLPDTRFVFEAHEHYPPAGPARSRPAGAVTFGSLNNLAKLNDRVLAAWAGILKRLPDASLLIQALALEDAPNKTAFLQRCAAAGMDSARIEVRPWRNLEDSARTYHDIDITLDPFPFCGGMSSFDSLWMGVPVVTLAGRLVAGRQSASMLANLGLRDLIADSVAEYADVAVALAQDTARLDHLRATLRADFAASPLCDYDKFTRTLEAAYAHLWQDWAAGPG